jgi:hypothetical protein
VATCPTAISRIDERFSSGRCGRPQLLRSRGSVAVVGHEVVPEIASKSVRTAIQPMIRFASANSGAAGAAIGLVWPRSMKRSAASGKAETPNVSAQAAGEKGCSRSQGADRVPQLGQRGIAPARPFKGVEREPEEPDGGG